MNTFFAEYEKVLRKTFKWTQGRVHQLEPGEPAFALISTLLIIAVLTIMVVAFMQSMRIDRITARSYLNKYRADLAVESGKYSVENALNLLTTNDSYIVVQNGNYTYVAETTNATNNIIKYLPLFSTSTNATNLLVSTNVTLVGPVPNLEPAAGTNTATIKSYTDTTRTVKATWVYMVNGSNEQIARFSYWVEDLNGRVNGAIAGNTNGITQHTRPTGTNANEIALYNLFSTNATDANGLLIVSNRDSIKISPKTYLAAMTNIPGLPNGKLIMDSMTVNTKLTSELETIPAGYGYTNQYKPKFNLNYFVQNGDVDALAAVISSNLPIFANRKGGLVDDYNKTLAANIISYARTNSTPLVGSGYRGVSSTPFVTVLHDKAVCTSISSSGGSYFANVTSSVFLQLWNPSNRTIIGNFKLEWSNDDDLIVGVNNPHMNDAASIISGYPFAITNISMNPNEVKVLEFGPITYKFDGGTTPMSTTNAISRNSPNHVRTTFKTYWGSGTDAPVVVDRSLGGMERRNGTLVPGVSNYKVTGGLPGLRLYGSDDYNTYAATTVHPMGDPRASYYLTPQIAQQSYNDRTSWWAMAIMRPSSATAVAAYYGDPRQWTDAAPNSSLPYPTTNSTTSITLNLSTANLTTYKASATGPNTNEAPAYFSTNNTYVSATELGNVYDPGQWHWPSAGTNIYPTSSIPTTATNDVTYGGGISLRIGRAEHPKFDTNGQRAYQLLDIFSVDPTTTNMTVNPRMISGKININTASTNALAALMAGIKMQKDVASGSKDVPPEVITAFINAVVAKRIQKPFLSTSELSGLTNASGTIFGNPKQWAVTNTIPATFKDVALEEMFSKVYDLTTVRSRVFRAVILGQALDKNGKVMATSRKEYYFSLDPVRDPATGLVTSQKCSVYYETDL